MLNDNSRKGWTDMKRKYGTDVMFHGAFKDLLREFVRQKCSLGYIYYTEAEILARFSRMTVELEVTEPSLTKGLVLKWMDVRADEKETYWEHRVNTLKQFAIYLVNTGRSAYVPRIYRKIDRRRFDPHIFTFKELKSFFHSCDTMRVNGNITTKAIVLPVLFRLLYGSGVRISEALNLKLRDIDLGNRIITIQNGKGDKDRLLPLSDGVMSHVNSLIKQLHVTSSINTHLFIKKNREKYAGDTIYRNFRALLWRCGISHGGKAYGPRVHDFRHTFAVHSLRNMVFSGKDVYCALPVLSTYLGHSSVEATERYVRLTSDCFPDVTKKIEVVSTFLFPEVFRETD